MPSTAPVTRRTSQSMACGASGCPTLGEAEGLVVIELTADGLIGAEWVIGVER
jgi:hypothetical protein